MFSRANVGGSGARMVIPNTYPNLSNIVHTDFELGRVIQTMAAADPGITVAKHESLLAMQLCIPLQFIML